MVKAVEMAVGMVSPDEQTPLLILHGGHKASVARTAGNIFISIVGAGVLGLPYTFRITGWAVAAGSVAGAACLTYYCMLLLVRWVSFMLYNSKIGSVGLVCASELSILAT